MTPQACPLRSHCFQCLGPIFALFLTSRIPFFSKNVKNVKIFCVVVAFKAKSGRISTKKNNTGQYVQVVAKIFDGVF